MRRSTRPEGTTLEALDGKELEVLGVIARRVVRRHDAQGFANREQREAVTEWRATVGAVDAELRFRAQRISATGTSGKLSR